MKTRKPAPRTLASLATLALLSVWVATPAGAQVIDTTGEGQSFYTTWTEFDLDDSLGLPGNVHVGYLSGWSDMYGTWFYGNVTDFDCDPGEVPWGGGHGVEAVAEEAADAVDDAVEDAIDAIIESGARVIDGDAVIDSVLSQLEDEIPEVVEEEAPACDYIQDRFLSGNDDEGNPTVEFTVDLEGIVTHITGVLIVTNGGHGEPGQVLGRPPINLSITGGQWQSYEYSYSSSGQGYKYSSWQKGTDYYGGTVSGAIGAMGFDDDDDDQSYGGFGGFSYRNRERIR